MNGRLNLGDVFSSNKSCSYTVVDIKDYLNITVKFNDEFGYTVTTDSTTVRQGRLKNPYEKKIFGVGYLGVGRFRAKLGPSSQGFSNTKEYNAWINMLSRCYYDNYTNRKIDTLAGRECVYDNVQVCQEWHNFQTFAEWYSNEYTRIALINNSVKLALDKDILQFNEALDKMYSPTTCALIPIELNCAFTNFGANKNTVNKSSIKERKDKTFVVYVRYGDKNTCIKGLKTYNDAVQVLTKHKAERLIYLANKYQNILRLEVYHALLRKATNL